MELQTNYKMGSGLAAAIAGQDNALQTERQTLSNVYQGLKNQEQEYTSAEAQAKMQDPRYIQMKLKNDMTKFGKETSINELEDGYNKSTRALLDLQIAQQQGPDAVIQKTVGYLNEMGIDPQSEQGQLILQDPIGFAQKTQQYFAAAATQNSDYQQKYGLKEAEAGWAMDRQRLANEGSLTAHQVSANASYAAQKYSTDKAVMVQAAGLAKNAEDNAAKYAEILRKLEPGVLDKQIAAKIKAANPELAQVEDTQLRDAMQTQLKYYQDEANRWKSYLPPMPRQPKIGGDQPAPTSGSPSLPPGVSVVTPK